MCVCLCCNGFVRACQRGFLPSIVSLLIVLIFMSNHGIGIWTGSFKTPVQYKHEVLHLVSVFSTPSTVYVNHKREQQRSFIINNQHFHQKKLSLKFSFKRSLKAGIRLVFICLIFQHFQKHALSFINWIPIFQTAIGFHLITTVWK